MAAAAATATATGEGEVTRQKRKKKPKPNHEDLGVAPSQSPQASKPLPSAPSLQTPTQSTAPRTPIQEEAATEAAMRKRKMRKEQKLEVLPLAQNPTSEEGDQGVDPVLATTTKKKHKERKPSPSPSAAAAAETPILELEAKVTKKRKPRKEQEPPGNSPLPVDPGQTQPRGTKAPHVSKLLPAAPFLEVPAQSPAPGASMFEEAGAGEAAMRKREVHKEQKVVALSLAQNPNLEEPAEERVPATTKKKKMHKEHNTLSLSPSATAAAETPILEQDSKVTRKRKRSKKQEPSGYSALPLDPGQTRLHGTNAPGSQMLEGEAAKVMRNRKIRKEQKVAALSLAENTTLEERREDAMTVKMKESKHMEHTLSCPSTSVASKTTIWEQEAKVKKKPKQRKQQGPSGESPSPLDPGQTQPQETHAPPLPAVPFLEAPAQSPAPEILTLEEAAAAVMRKKKICKEQKVAALSLAQSTTLEEQREDTMMAKNKESKHMKHTLSCPSTSVASKTTIWEQEGKVNKKQKHWKQRQSPLPLDPGKIQPQGTHAPPLPAIPFLEAPAQSPAPEIPTLEEAAAAVMRRKICKEQKVVALSLPQNTALEEPREDAMMAKNKESKHMKHTLSCPSTSVASKTTNWEQEAKVNKKQKQRKQQAPSDESPLPLDPGKIQPQGTQHAPLLPAIPFLEAPAQSPAPEIPTLEEVAAAVMRRKICKEQKVVALSLAQNTALEEPREDAMMAKNKESKHMKHTLSCPSTSVASKTTNWEQEVKVNKKQKQRKQQAPSGESPLPLDPGKIQPQGTQHAPLLPAIPFLEAPAQSPAPEIPTLEEAAAAVMRRKICKEQKVAALSLAQNTPLEEQREDVMMAKNKDSKHMKHTISSPTSVAAETTIWEQEVKVTEKQKQMKQEQPSGKSALPLNPGQAHCVQPQGSKAPPEQEQEANGRMGSSIKKNNGKRPRVRVLSKCELIKEASKKQPALPEGFVAFSDFVSSCTEQNPDHPSPYSAFFDQFRYNPVRGDHKPPLPRTPDRLARLPPRKLKKKDSGSGSIPGSQDKLHAKEKINPENKMKAKKPLLTRAEKSSDKYRRVPLDQLVPPPRSPHNLLQEKYASDPWKVIVICMLLNLTQGKQVKNIIEGFFECYPDPQSACIADPDKMAGYLACLGLQRVKTLRIQRFSKEYVEKEWTYITELCGVGKYAADAYAIFCAGRATEVVPQDHKLVDYWKYVCFELPMMQKSQNAQEAGVPEQELAVMC